MTAGVRPFDLEGSKAIAAVLERMWGVPVSVFAVSRFMARPDDPLPHYRLHVRGRVWARVLEVEQWAFQYLLQTSQTRILDSDDE